MKDLFNLTPLPHSLFITTYAPVKHVTLMPPPPPPHYIHNHIFSFGRFYMFLIFNSWKLLFQMLNVFTRGQLVF